MLYITDCEVVKWKFRDINHILLGVNYDKDLIGRDNTGKANHVFRGHLSIDTACDFVKANYSDSLQNVIMCHLSSENSDSDSFIEKMKKPLVGRMWMLQSLIKNGFLGKEMNVRFENRKNKICRYETKSY